MRPEMTGDPFSPPVFTVGDIEIHRVMDLYSTFRLPEDCFPTNAADVKAFIEAHGDFYRPWALDPKTGKLMLAVQTYVLKTDKLTVLVDTCVGCDKSYERMPAWHKRTDTGWLTRLAAAGFAPEQIDYVLCTHLHGDHVGWNTRLIDGVWVPTFPKATYLMTRIEEETSRGLGSPVYQESVSPVIAAGQAQLVDADFALTDEIWIEPSHGHSPGHVSVRLRSKGMEATLTGDAFHSPIQLQNAHWSFYADADPEQAIATRKAIFEAHCETDRLLMPAHFPAPSVGYVTRKGDGFGFRWKEF